MRTDGTLGGDPTVLTRCVLIAARVDREAHWRWRTCYMGETSIRSPRPLKTFGRCHFACWTTSRSAQMRRAPRPTMGLARRLYPLTFPDVQQESVRTAGATLCRTLAAITVRVCDPEQVSGCLTVLGEVTTLMARSRSLQLPRVLVDHPAWTNQTAARDCRTVPARPWRVF